MILYTLRCAGDHEFEAWFRNGATYEAQAAAGEIACPECGDTEDEKAPMAPRVATSKSEPSPADIRRMLQQGVKHVLGRGDLKVPLKDGRVTDATRIERAVPTLKELSEKSAKVIVLSHFGRPRGKADPAFSLKPLVEPLSQALGGKPVGFARDCIGPEAERVVAAMKAGDVALLENLRFHPEEEKNDGGF